MEDRPHVAGTASTAKLRPEARDVTQRKAHGHRNLVPIIQHKTRSGDSEPTDIGEPRFVGESGWWDAPTEPMEIGERLDADDPTTVWSASSEVMELGEPRDADFPGTGASQTWPVARDVGRPLDADSPWHDQTEAARRPLDIGPPLKAKHFDRGSLQDDTEE